MKYVCIQLEHGQYFLVSSKVTRGRNPRIPITKKAAEELLRAGGRICSK
jgi:hypothetical protein